MKHPLLTQFLRFLSTLPAPLAEPLARLAGIRFPGLALEFIGHQAPEPELFYKEGILGLRKKYRFEVLLAPPAKVANQHLMTYWEAFFPVIRDPGLCAALEPLARRPQMCLPRKHYIEALDQTAAFPRIHELWGNRPPLLKLTEADRAFGWDILRRWGLKDGDWFACVHCREGGFDKNTRCHSFRNAQVENFLPAIQEITARGGWVVRLGDASMTPLPKMPRVVDYALSPDKSARMDVFLCAGSRFLLGSSSGPAMLCSVFGVPCGITNNAPMGVTLLYAPPDIGIPKLVRSQRAGRILTFPEVLGAPVSNFRFAEQYEQEGYEVIENTPDDIRWLARELLERAEGTWQPAPDDEAFQKTFKSLFRPGHYTYGSTSRAGRDFLRSHRNLLTPPATWDPTS